MKTLTSTNSDNSESMNDLIIVNSFSAVERNGENDIDADCSVSDPANIDMEDTPDDCSNRKPASIAKKRNESIICEC